MRSVIGAAATAAIAVLPLVLLGVMAVLVRADLGFSEAGLGSATAFFFLASGLTSRFGGTLGSLLGPQRAVLLAGVIAGCSLAGVALVSNSWLTLCIFLLLGGVGHGIGQPASSLVLVRLVSPERQGISFGIKQSATAVSGILAGLAVPMLAINYGWRWIFGGAAVLGVVPWLLLPKVGTAQQKPSVRKDSKVIRPWLLLFAAGWAFGTIGIAGLATFLVEGAVASGISLKSAGLILALGSAAGIITRVSGGIFADRHPDKVVYVVVAMLAAGCLSFGVLAISDSATIFTVGTILAYSFAWGWPGILQFAVVRLVPHAPSEAIGITQTGVALGSVVGPIGLGILIVEVSYMAAWFTAACSLAVAAGLVELGRRHLPLDNGLTAR
jgi:predicted MFS family arabinose efflux permease